MTEVLDDLMEIALELGGEAAGAAMEWMREKKKGGKRGAGSPKGEPWDRVEKRPPWEE